MSKRKSVKRKPGAGRPRSAHTLGDAISFRLSADVSAALAKYRDTLDVEGIAIPAAARDLLTKSLRDKGFLQS